LVSFIRADLLADLRMLPRSSVIRKINDLVKRARLVKVHAHIVAHLRAQMPAMFGGDTKKEELLATMGEVFKTVAKNHALTSGDFPSASEYRTKFKRDDFYKFQPLHPKLIGAMEQVGIPIKLSTHSLYLSIYLYIYISRYNYQLTGGRMEQVLHTDIPALMAMLPDEAAYAYAAAEVRASKFTITPICDE
jgi:hypothetical protein